MQSTAGTVRWQKSGSTFMTEANVLSTFFFLGSEMVIIFGKHIKLIAVI